MYILVTAIFLPLIYKSYRARTLVLSYLSNDVYHQVRGIMGFYFLITKVTYNFYSVMSKFMRVYMLIMKLNINVYMKKTRYVIDSYKRVFKVR